MRRLPWRATLRADGKATLTAVAVALGVAFAVAGFSVPAGLGSETISEEGPFARPDAIVSNGDGSPIARERLGSHALGVIVARAPLRDGGTITLLAIEGDARYQVAPNEARPGRHEWPTLAVNLTDRTLTVGEPLVDARVPRGWLLVDAAVVRAHAPELAEAEVTYGILPAGESGRAAREDLAWAEVPGVAPFFRASALEVVRDLVLVVAFSSILVGLLVYEFLRIEIRERRREIGIWRSLGMSSRDVLALLLARAGLVALLGAIVGVGLALAALALAAQATSAGLFVAGLSVTTALALVLVFTLAGLAGASFPALSAAREDVALALEERA